MYLRPYAVKAPSDLSRIPPDPAILNVNVSSVEASYMTAKCRVERDMPERADREENAKTLLRAEMAGRGTTCAQLVEKLAVIGVEDSEWSLRN